MVLFFKKGLLAACLICAPLAQAIASPRTDAAARLAKSEQERSRRILAQNTAARDLEAASAQAARLADMRAGQADALRAIEARVVAAAEGLAGAARDEAQAEAALARTRASFATLLPVMLRLSQYPAETVLAVPAPPAQALQGLLVTRGLAITLNRQAARLRLEQDQAMAARENTSQQSDALAQERAKQAAAAAALDRVVAQARDQVTQAEAEGRDAALQVQAAAAQTRTLRDAIAAMDAEAAKASAEAARQAAAADRLRQVRAARVARARQAAVTRPSGNMAGGNMPVGAMPSGTAAQLLAPVAGAVLRGFGAPAEDGPATGITYGAAAGAYVSAPCRGRVAFAAPFRSYGRLIILECGGGYDVVLAGLASIAISPGHAVRPGEPLGRMPDVVRAGLYVELRASGHPVDPAPFLKPKL